MLINARAIVVDHIKRLELFIEALSTFFKLLLGKIVLRFHQYLIKQKELYGKIGTKYDI